jgi:hypothetical protein
MFASRLVYEDNTMERVGRKGMPKFKSRMPSSKFLNHPATTNAHLNVNAANAGRNITIEQSMGLTDKTWQSEEADKVVRAAQQGHSITRDMSEMWATTTEILGRGASEDFKDVISDPYTMGIFALIGGGLVYLAVQNA